MARCIRVSCYSHCCRYSDLGATHLTPLSLPSVCWYACRRNWTSIASADSTAAAPIGVSPWRSVAWVKSSAPPAPPSPGA